MHITLLDHDETYNMNTPDFAVRGLLIGSMLTEFVGTVTLECPKTGFRLDKQCDMML